MEFQILNRTLGNVTITLSDEDRDLSKIRWSLAGGKGHVGKYARNPSVGYLHRIVAHRIGLIEKVVGEGRSASSIDHINGDKLDNRRENLRVLTRKQQMINPNDGLRSTNTSGERGVSFIKKRAHLPTPWYASVMVNGKTINLGMYATKEEASAARRCWDEEN